MSTVHSVRICIICLILDTAIHLFNHWHDVFHYHVWPVILINNLLIYDCANFPRNPDSKTNICNFTRARFAHYIITYLHKFGCTFNYSTLCSMKCLVSFRNKYMLVYSTVRSHMSSIIYSS